jgi:hypothetical protein
MSADPLHTSNNAEENDTGKYMELSFSTVFIQGHSTLHYNTGKSPSFTLTVTQDLTAHIATMLTKNTARQTSTLTLWRRNFLLNFSTLCISIVNNTGTKKGSIMK